jgi:hypothetical protein
MARSRDQTSFGTAGTPEVLRSPPTASREPRRLLSSTPFQSSSGECRFIWLVRVHSENPNGGTKHHSELLEPFGLDARDPSFWQGGLSVIERL